MVRFLFSSLLMILGLTAFAQSSTTGSLLGKVTDQAGAPIVGAIVQATHNNSGTKYTTETLDNGNYLLSNMRVGDGGYAIRVVILGYHEYSAANIGELTLNQRSVYNVKLTPSTLELSTIEVNARVDDPMNAERTGQQTVVNSATIAALPSISRSQNDFIRLNPQFASGGSIGGRNDQFNNFTLDGAIYNNPFGLDAATPGGQADANPVSLDAIEQISVSIAPYDVTQAGFTGAAVNAVTKSGSNKFHGTVFGYFRNKSMYGATVDGVDVSRGDLQQTQGGISIGGPIIKDKVFFFVNYEQSRSSDFGSYFLANRGQTGANISRVLASDLDAVSSLLASRYGYQTGAYENFRFATESDKALVKLDFNISGKHKLSITGNTLIAFKDKPANPSAIGRRGPDFLTLQFQNSGYRINNNLYNVIGELKSSFNSRMGNKFQMGYTIFNDSRDPFSSPFPVLNIDKGGVRYIVAGHEPFSISNKLDQNVFQVTDNFTYIAGKHNITIGASFEKFSFDNSFNLTGYGARVFFPGIEMDSFANFINAGGLDAEVAGAIAADSANASGEHKFGNWALAETNLGQAAVYLQDEFEVNTKLKLTYGVRIDMPLYFDTEQKMQESIDRNCCYDATIEYYDETGAATKLNSLEFPKQTPLISPRIGFNYDLKGNRNTVIRGGTGLFTGRLPFVWIGNQVANPNSFFYCVTAPDFKFPQVWRTSLGVDQRLGSWIASIDLGYTKDINAMMVRNYGLKTPTGTLVGADDRPVYQAADKGTNTAYVFTNVKDGYTFNGSFQIERGFKNGFYAKFGYNYLKAMDVASIDAEISSDGFDRNPATISNTNQASLAPSLFGNRHRILGVVSKKFVYGGGHWGTTISLFGEQVEGNRFSYTYAGDLNNDGSGLNDLLYVPTAAEVSSMNFVGSDVEAAAQRAAFEAYINQDEYLSGLRGEYTEKYAALSPWYGNTDIRIMQEYKFTGGQAIQVNADILNVGNLINNSWGVRQYASYTGLNQPVSYRGNDADGKPTYSFDTAQKTTFFNDFSLLSRWQMQVGLRFIF
jgi:Carboxypeptidase regulatory-like domain